MKRPLFAAVAAAIIVGAAAVALLLHVGRTSNQTSSVKPQAVSFSASHEHIASLSPVSATALLSAPVPAACNHPAGNLVNGRLPGIPRLSGRVQLGWLDDPSSQRDRLAFGDLDGDGRPDAAAVLECDLGGDAWPQLIAFYTAGPKLLGSVNLRSINLPGHTAGMNDIVHKLSFNNGAIDVTWATQQDDDNAATATLAYSATLRWKGRSIVSSNLTATTEVDTTLTFLADLRHGDTSAASALTAPGVGAEAVNQFRLYPNALKSSPDCHGLHDPNIPKRVKALVDSGIFTYQNTNGICLLPAAAHGANHIVLGMKNIGFRHWQLTWVRVV